MIHENVFFGDKDPEAVIVFFVEAFEMLASKSKTEIHTKDFFLLKLTQIQNHCMYEMVKLPHHWSLKMTLMTDTSTQFLQKQKNMVLDLLYPSLCEMLTSVLIHYFKK